MLFGQMLRTSLTALSMLVVLGATPLRAQTPTPTPGPTNPNPLPPASELGKTIVINPSIEECRRGWVSGMSWTKDEFDRHCSRIMTSK